MPYTNILIAGTNCDLREDHDTIEKLKNKGLKPVTKEEGEQLCEDIYALEYIEVSSRTNQNVKYLFETAVKSFSFTPKSIPHTEESQKKNCILF